MYTSPQQHLHADDFPEKKLLLCTSEWGQAPKDQMLVIVPKLCRTLHCQACKVWPATLNGAFLPVTVRLCRHGMTYLVL